MIIMMEDFTILWHSLLRYFVIVLDLRPILRQHINNTIAKFNIVDL